MKLAICTGFLFLQLGTIAPVNAQERYGNQPQEWQNYRRRYENQPQDWQYPPPRYGNHLQDWQYPPPRPAQRPQQTYGWNPRSWSQRGGYNGYRIPEDRFRLYFGPGNFFIIGGSPRVFVDGYSRFLYNGYWITFINPWPEWWEPRWFQTDEVYIVYEGDGYYLYNRRYPSVRIAVTLSF